MIASKGEVCTYPQRKYQSTCLKKVTFGLLSRLEDVDDDRKGVKKYLCTYHIHVVVVEIDFLLPLGLPGPGNDTKLATSDVTPG